MNTIVNNYTGYFLKLNLTHFTYVQLLQFHSNAIVKFIHLIIIHVTIKNIFFSFMTEIKDPHILIVSIKTCKFSIANPIQIKDGISLEYEITCRLNT